MATTDSNGAIWEEIERSESYLVCSMYEEAASLAAATLKRLCTNDDNTNYDMLESAGMVLVQSLKELRRTPDILNELELSFLSVAAIPVEVLLSGACFDITKGSSNVHKYLEEYLSKWSLVDEECYVLVSAEKYAAPREYVDGRFILSVNKYLEVVDVYLQTLTGTNLNDMDLAKSWVLKAALPEEKRQGILRRIESLHSLKAPSLSKVPPSPLLQDNNEPPIKQIKIFEGSPKALQSGYLANGENVTGKAVLKLSKRMEPCTWWFRTITLKFGGARLVITNGKIVLGCLMLLLYYVLRRKRATLKRIVSERALSIKNALVDMWQLAFSYQVNPLAAVQSLPAATHGGQR